MLAEAAKTREHAPLIGVRSLVTGLKQPEVHPVHFDPQRRAATAELKAAVKTLCKFLEQREGELGQRRRSRSASSLRGFRVAVEALTCNLAGLVMLGLEQPLAVPRHNGAMWGKARYRSPVYGQHFLDVLDLMAHPQVGLIEDVARGYRFKEGPSQRSIVRPLAQLLNHVPSRLFEWQAFQREEDPEVLVLRGRKDPRTGHAEPIDYPETTTTRRLRAQVQSINGNLRAALVVLLPDGTARTGDDQPIDPTRRTVRRIFNNGSWKQGGRLYGAFWETMKREDRFRLLRIGTRAHPEGEPIANVDYGQLYARLAYLEAGYTTPSEEDLYDIAGDALNREGWKQLLNALLLTSKPLGNWPEGAREKFPPGTNLREAVSAIRERHAPIAHLFGSGVGLRLMVSESGMLIETLFQLLERGVTALPLHDSVLVPATEAAAAEETMQAVFAKFTGGTHISIKTTIS